MTKDPDKQNNFNLLFITQDDPFYVRCFFDEFFKIYPVLEEIEGVVIERPLGKNSAWALMKQMHAFYGSVDFARAGFRYAKVKGLNSLYKFHKKTEYLNVENLCRWYGRKAYCQNGIHKAEFLNDLQQMNLDLIVSVAAPTVFRKELIDLPRLGCINIHHAPLPRYRGMMPNFWQLYHGEKTVGITIHKINERIDGGEILLQRQIPVVPGESLDELIKRTKRAGAHLMVETIERLKKGEDHSMANRPEEGSYFSFPTSRDVRKFRSMGYRLL